MTTILEPATFEPPAPLLKKVVRWLCRIGLVVRPGTEFSAPFIDGIWVVNGELVYDPDCAHPGNMLHEAGHLAVLPSIIRRRVSGDVEESAEPFIEQYLDEHPEGLAYWPEDPFARACIQAGDQEAIAWSYAAALACKVDPWLVCEYGFPSPEDGREVLIGLKAGASPGIHGLRAAGFIDSVRDFPKLKRWLQV